MINKKLLIIALLIPILFLLGFTIKNQLALSHGKEFSLPVEGFDPRDLIAGHYLIYRVNYGGVPKCSVGQKLSYVCLDPYGDYASLKPEDGSCKLFIKGSCEYGGFSAGIEKFYIPEEFSRELTSKIVNHKGKILISVSKSGDAIIKDLLIENCPWKKYISGYCP